MVYDKIKLPFKMGRKSETGYLEKPQTVVLELYPLSHSVHTGSRTPFGEKAHLLTQQVLTEQLLGIHHQAGNWQNSG